MKDIVIKLEDQAYDTLSERAAKKGTEPEHLAEELVMQWIQQGEKGESRQELRQRFLKMRLKGSEVSEISETLGCGLDVIEHWNEEIKADPNVWTNSFFYLRKSVDPLRWEMRFMDRFYELWGQKPQGS
jgi:hypothetical protein